MVFVILNMSGKRIRLGDGKLTPAFDIPEQAIKYIDRILGGSPSARIIRVGDD